MILLTVTALASVPAGVRGAAAPMDAPQLYAKRHPERAPLACTPMWEGHAQLCFRVREGGRNRWVTEADLGRWEVDRAALRLHVLERGQAIVRSAVEQRYVEGMPESAASRYLQVRDGDGWAVAGVLQARALSEVLGGGKLRVALPRAGVLFAWADPEVAGLTPAQAAELDHILTVATREAYEAADDAVSPMVHVWKDGRFVPFAVARPKEKQTNE